MQRWTTRAAGGAAADVWGEYVRGLHASGGGSRGKAVGGTGSILISYGSGGGVPQQQLGRRQHGKLPSFEPCVFLAPGLRWVVEPCSHAAVFSTAAAAAGAPTWQGVPRGGWIARRSGGGAGRGGGGGGATSPSEVLRQSLAEGALSWEDSEGDAARPVRGAGGAAAWAGGVAERGEGYGVIDVRGAAAVCPALLVAPLAEVSEG